MNQKTLIGIARPVNLLDSGTAEPFELQRYAAVAAEYTPSRSGVRESTPVYIRPPRIVHHTMRVQRPAWQRPEAVKRRGDPSGLSLTVAALLVCYAILLAAWLIGCGDPMVRPTVPDRVPPKSSAAYTIVDQDAGAPVNPLPGDLPSYYVEDAACPICQ